MSLVGPRPSGRSSSPSSPAAIARYDDRHRVPVGVTGLAQVKGLRGDTSIEDRARFDNAYIENWSLWSDIVILVRTVMARRQAAAQRSPGPPGVGRRSLLTGLDSGLSGGRLPAAGAPGRSSTAAPMRRSRRRPARAER